jgi:hypothetical protein
MQRQVTRGILPALLGGLLLVGCSSGNGTKTDTSVSTKRRDSAPVAEEICDEQVMGENYCIINSPSPYGTIVQRQEPTTCKQ